MQLRWDNGDTTQGGLETTVEDDPATVPLYAQQPIHREDTERMGIPQPFGYHTFTGEGYRKTTPGGTLRVYCMLCGRPYDCLAQATADHRCPPYSI